MNAPSDPRSATSSSRVPWRYVVPLAIGLVLWFAPAPEGLSPKAWHMFAIFVATIAGIIAAPLPMSAVAIIGATAAALTDVVSMADVVKSTGTDLVWLILLSFFISRGIIEQHGGTISVDSVEGCGSTFTLRLPLRTDERSAEQPQALSAS